MSVCASCGQKLSARTGRCARCATSQIAEQGQAYGMVDLDAGAAQGAAPALDMLDDGSGTPSRGSRVSRVSRADAARDAAGRNPKTSRSSSTLKAAGRTHGGTTAKAQERPAPQPEVDPASMASYGRGMMLDDDPLNSTFGGGASASLELGAERSAATRRGAVPAAAPEPEAEPEPVPEETPAQQRQKRVVEIAGYGPPPARPYHAPLYWFRVVTRKRVLDEELSALSVQRKRADEQAQDALQRLGEALFALAKEPALGPLRKQLSAVAEAQSRMGDTAAEGEKRSQSRKGALAKLTRELKHAEAEAQPIAERVAQLEAEVAGLRGRAQQCDALRRKADAELEAAQRGKTALDPQRRAALIAERDRHLDAYQSIGIQLQPLEDDLARVQAELEQRQRRVAALQQEARGAAAALDRANDTQRVSMGSAQAARQQALASLANAALRAGVTKMSSKLDLVARAATEAAAAVEQPRQLEELHRAAANSYDHAAYLLGYRLLVGGSITLFVSLAVAVLF